MWKIGIGSRNYFKRTNILQCYCLYVKRLAARENSSATLTDYFCVAPEVQEALVTNKPVVALESTIITHGMPYPHNYQTAIDVEEIIRNNGATPATIAILNGKIHVGVPKADIDFLASGNSGAVKTSRRDLPIVLSRHLNGGTTVSGTMLAAYKVGIPIFVTGGIGGVHRGAETTLDISADLTELGRTSVAVISAGVKSILDIEKTLEYLETQGVCVATYGPSRDFPSFFTPKSGFQAPYNVNGPKEAALMIDANLSFGVGSGMLVAVPVPEGQGSGEEIEEAIQTALTEAKLMGIKGKETTPFILSKVNKLTSGSSLESNIALIKHNADIGSKIAVELSKLQVNKCGHSTGRQSSEKTMQHVVHASDDATSESVDGRAKIGRPVVVGGSIVDFIITNSADDIAFNGATYPGHIRQSFGGVGRNLADGLSRLGSNPLFISAVGQDSHMRALLHYCKHMDHTGILQVPNHSTATYCALLKNTGELMFGVGDMDTHYCVSPDHIAKFEDDIRHAPIVLMDGNIPVESMLLVCELCNKYKVPLWYEPTDIHKAGKPFHDLAASKAIVYTSPNINELRQIRATVTGTRNTCSAGTDAKCQSMNNLIEESLSICKVLVGQIPNILVTLGEHGVLLCRNTELADDFPVSGSPVQASSGFHAAHYPPCLHEQLPSNIISVSGAGDCLVAAAVLGIIHRKTPGMCLKSGLHAAQQSLRSHHAVPHTLTADDYKESKIELWAPWKPNILS